MRLQDNWPHSSVLTDSLRAAFPLYTYSCGGIKYRLTVINNEISRYYFGKMKAINTRTLPHDFLQQTKTWRGSRNTKVKDYRSAMLWKVVTLTNSGRWSFIMYWGEKEKALWGGWKVTVVTLGFLLTWHYTWECRFSPYILL